MLDHHCFATFGRFGLNGPNVYVRFVVKYVFTLNGDLNGLGSMGARASWTRIFRFGLATYIEYYQFLKGWYYTIYLSDVTIDVLFYYVR